jgi:hypothetical protein
MTEADSDSARQAQGQVSGLWSVSGLTFPFQVHQELAFLSAPRVETVRAVTPVSHAVFIKRLMCSPIGW